MAFGTGNEAGHLNPATFSHPRGPKFWARFWHIIARSFTCQRSEEEIRTLSIVAKRYTKLLLKQAR